VDAPRLKTDDYLIRPFERKDLATFARYRSREVVARYQSWTTFTEEDAVALFEGMSDSSFGTVGSWFQLAIASLGSDHLVGDLAVHFIDEQQVEIGFTVAPEHQGKRVATQAVSRLLRYLFAVLQKHRVVARTDTRNRASCRLLEKLGFRREGHLVENVFFKGAWGDEYLYALLRSEQRFTDPEDVPAGRVPG